MMTAAGYDFQEENSHILDNYISSAIIASAVVTK